MSRRSPLDYDISVAADKRRRARMRGMSGRVESAHGCCEWPGCNEPAHYRAPKSRDQINEYRWFCLYHVRQYNQAWNFFEGYGVADVDAARDSDRVWGRETWRMGQGPANRAGMNPHANGDAWARWGFNDLHEVLGDNATINPGNPGAGRGGTSAPPPRQRRLPREVIAALDTLGLEHDVAALAEIRQRYNDLVKALHPDMNGGHEPQPGRLPRVLKAWRLLKHSAHFTR
ncbi:MAG: J domain-containing protein [Pseudomonadota bacterium]